MESQLLERREGKTVWLTLNRPAALNALSAQLFHELLETLPRLNRDPEVAVIVITGSGRGFCAGGDVKEMEGRDSNRTFEQRVQELMRRSELTRLVHESPKLTVAMVNGVAAGAGFGLAMACDFRFASDQAKLTTAYIKIGFPGDLGTTFFLSALVGPARARQMLLKGGMYSAAEAEQVGIVDAICSPGALEDEVRSFATEMAAGPYLAYGYVKQNVRAAERGRLQDVYEAEASGTIRMATTEDHSEAIKAFADKRPPTFAGR